MSVYARFKRDPDGFRKLVELLESTPASRRQKMIDVGMKEDPAYTERAMEYLMDFKDVLGLPDEELAEVVGDSPGRIVAYAINKADDATKERFLRAAQPKKLAEIRDFIEVEAGPTEIGGAQLQMVSVARQLEKRGLVKAKKIPA